MTDNRGTELKIGQEVVCNVSGEVAKGRLVEIKKSSSAYKPIIFHVELAHSAAGNKKGHISKITNSRNLLVLLDEDPMTPVTCPNCGQTPMTNA